MNEVSSTHPQQTPQYQLLKVDTDLTREVAKLTVTFDKGADDGEFVFEFTDPFNNTEKHLTEKVKAGCSANDIKDVIKEFYQHSVKTDPAVTRTCF